VGLHHVLGAVFAHWPTLHRTLDSSAGQSFSASLPAAALLGGTVMRGLFLSGLVLLIASFLAAHVKRGWPRLLLFVFGVLVFTGNDWGNRADLIQHGLAAAILLAVYVFGVRNVIRFNLLGCFLIAVLTSILGGALEPLAQPNEFYRANGYALVACILLVLAWPLMAWRMQPART
jgi:hypothetical protein